MLVSSEKQNLTTIDESCKWQLHKKVKHPQTILRQQRVNCLNVFDHFVGQALKELNWISKTITWNIYYKNYKVTLYIRRKLGKLLTLICKKFIKTILFVQYRQLWSSALLSK